MKYRSNTRRRSEVWMKVRDAETLSRWRKRRGLSQRDLAYLARCSQAAISLIERGELKTLSEDLALTIARRLDVPWEDLFVPRESAGVRRVTNARSSAPQVAA